MSLKKIIGLFLFCSLLALPQSSSLADLEITEAPYTIQADFFATLYGVDSSIVNKVLDCESNYNHSAKGDGGKSKGIAQIQKPTWNWMELQYFKEWGEHLNYESSFDQIKMLAYQISKGNGNNWTSYVAIKKGGKYSFYSSQLKKHFIVYCKLELP